MIRLLRAGLMYGNLIEVRSPALVTRYNRALKQLVGKETALSEFHIDISGFSPEIAEELGDDLYLNPLGVNRMFILLTTAQKTAPLLNAQFSFSRAIIRDFIDQNEDALFALTAREAVAGELLNSVLKARKPSDLLSIRTITIEADTVQKHIAGGQELSDKIDQFMHDIDAWWDDVLIADMIELAKVTGDVQRAPFALDHLEHVQGNFYTKHFGGLYVFRDCETPGVIAVDPELDMDDIDLGWKIHLDQPVKVARFLLENNLVEPSVNRRDIRTSQMLEQKMDFMTISVAADNGYDLSNLSRKDLRSLARKLVNKLPDAYFDLRRLLLWATNEAGWPSIGSDDESYFYTQRATQGTDRDLVNQLIAEFCTLDFRQLFICHKDAFYAAYASWNDEKRDYAVQFLEREYLADKQAAREALFGADEPLLEVKEEPDLIVRVGPWGSIKR